MESEPNKPKPPSPLVWVAAGYAMLMVSAAVGIAAPDGEAISWGRMIHWAGVVLHYLFVVIGVAFAGFEIFHRRQMLNSILAILIACPMLFFLWPAGM